MARLGQVDYCDSSLFRSPKFSTESVKSPGSKYGGGLLTKAYQKISPNSSPTGENLDPNPSVKSPKKRVSMGIPLVGLAASTAPTPTTVGKPTKPPKPAMTSFKSAKKDLVYMTPLAFAPRQDETPAFYSAANTPANPSRQLFAGPAFLDSIKGMKREPDNSPTGSPKDPRAMLGNFLASRLGQPPGDLSTKPAKSAVSTDPVESALGRIKYKDHPVYGKYFTRLRMMVPLEAVKHGMIKDGVDPSAIDNDPDSFAPIEQPKICYRNHPKYAKYFTMLAKGIPEIGVRNSMKMDGIDPSILDRNPDEIVVEQGGDLIALKDHPVYAKYFKLAKTLLKDQVQHKMRMDGENPAILDRNPEELVRKNGKLSPPPKQSSNQPAPRSTIRKKKFYWNEVDPSRIKGNSLWAESNEDYEPKLDEAEFNELFVEDQSKKSTKTISTPVDDAKTKQIVLIDPKRSRLGNIALARVKIPHDDVRQHLNNLNDEPFTTDQLKNLLDYLPTKEECEILANYRGELSSLGTVERFMLTMVGFPTAQARMECMIFKQTHKSRVIEMKCNATIIEKACDDIKLSVGLKKVLKTILRVGNQMNDADKVCFTYCDERAL